MKRKKGKLTSIFHICIMLSLSLFLSLSRSFSYSLRTRATMGNTESQFEFFKFIVRYGNKSNLSYVALNSSCVCAFPGLSQFERNETPKKRIVFLAIS